MRLWYTLNPRPLARGIVASGGTLGQVRFNLFCFLVQFLLGAVSGGGRRSFWCRSSAVSAALWFRFMRNLVQLWYTWNPTASWCSSGAIWCGFWCRSGAVSTAILMRFLLPPAVRQTPICTAKPPSAVRCAAAVHHLRIIAAPVRLDRARQSFISLAPLSKKACNASSTCMIMRPESWPLGAMRWGQSSMSRA